MNPYPWALGPWPHGSRGPMAPGPSDLLFGGIAALLFPCVALLFPCVDIWTCLSDAQLQMPTGLRPLTFRTLASELLGCFQHMGIRGPHKGIIEPHKGIIRPEYPHIKGPWGRAHGPRAQEPRAHGFMGPWTHGPFMQEYSGPIIPLCGPIIPLWSAGPQAPFTG